MLKICDPRVRLLSGHPYKLSGAEGMWDPEVGGTAMKCGLMNTAGLLHTWTFMNLWSSAQRAWYLQLPPPQAEELVVTVLLRNREALSVQAMAAGSILTSKLALIGSDSYSKTKRTWRWGGNMLAGGRLWDGKEELAEAGVMGVYIIKIHITHIWNFQRLIKHNKV